MVARLPRLPEALTENPAHRLMRAVAKLAVKAPAALATARVVTDDPASRSTTRTCSCPANPDPRTVMGLTRTNLSCGLDAAGAPPTVPATRPAAATTAATEAVVYRIPPVWTPWLALQTPCC